MIDAEGIIRCECDFCKARKDGKGQKMGVVKNGIVEIQITSHSIAHFVRLNGYVLLATGLKTDENSRRLERPKAQMRPIEPLGAPEKQVGQPLYNRPVG